MGPSLLITLKYYTNHRMEEGKINLMGSVVMKHKIITYFVIKHSETLEAFKTLKTCTNFVHFVYVHQHAHTHTHTCVYVRALDKRCRVFSLTSDTVQITLLDNTLRNLSSPKTITFKGLRLPQ